VFTLLANGPYLVSQATPPFGYQATPALPTTATDYSNGAPRQLTFLNTLGQGLVVRLERPGPSTGSTALYKTSGLCATLAGPVTVQRCDRAPASATNDGVADGFITFAVPDGAYTLTISKGGNQLDMALPAPIAVVIAAGVVSNRTVVIRPYLTLAVRAHDALTGDALGGVCYTATPQFADYLPVTKCGAGTGDVVFTLLANGPYLVSQDTPPFGYQATPALPTTATDYSLSASRQLTFLNTLGQGLVVRLEKPAYGGSTALFTTSKLCATLAGPVTVQRCDRAPANGTNDGLADGFITFAVPDGAYTLTISKGGNQLDMALPAPVAVVITAGVVSNRTVVIRTYLTLAVRAHDALTGEALGGVCYTATPQFADYLPVTKCGAGTGDVVFTLLANGPYLVSQATPPFGYQATPALTSGSSDYSLSASRQLTFLNTALPIPYDVLLASPNGTRSATEPLDGLTVPASYIVTFQPSASSVSVEFRLDGGFLRTVNAAPYDAFGTKPDGSAKAISTVHLASGTSHTVTAVVRNGIGAIILTVTATFTVL